MVSSKSNLILFLLIVGYIEQVVTSECPNSFPSGDTENLCYSYKQTSLLSWSDAYNQCLLKTIDGTLIEISSIAQFNALKQANIDNKTPFWLGANNFASFVDSQWHWLDGSIVDSSVVTWCSNSTYDTALGAYCAAYDSTLQCVTNYLCSALLPAPCVGLTDGKVKQAKSVLTARLIGSTGTCTNTYGGAYANWWTYSVLLLNWFMLFSFVLYVTTRLNLNKLTVILTMCITILSFMMIMVFAILWGVQYQDILVLPVVIAIIGCIASLLFFIYILILVSNRTYVHRSMTCMIVTIIIIIIECGLMLGIILCFANCSGYISLASTNIDKDVIAALLSAVLAAITIGFCFVILYLMGPSRSDSIQRIRSDPVDVGPAIAAQAVQSRHSQNNNRVDSRRTAPKHDQIDRGTSPVDERILDEFYADRPKQMHQYNLEGRQYIVYEGKTFNDIDPYRKDLTQAMLLQEPQGLRESISRAKASPHAPALTEEIRQAEGLLGRLK